MGERDKKCNRGKDNIYVGENEGRLGKRIGRRESPNTKED